MHICAFDLDLEKRGNGDICKSTPSSHKKFKRFLTDSARKENSQKNFCQGMIKQESPLGTSMTVDWELNDVNMVLRSVLHV